MKDNRSRSVGRCPPAHALPWMRVEIRGKREWVVFALAVHDGRIVECAPVARSMLGLPARDVWKHYAHRGAKLTRLEPPGDLMTSKRSEA